MKVREAQLYSEKVEEGDVKNFFNQIVKAKLPFLGFLDFSGIFSLNAINMIIRRKQNTITFYVKEKASLQNLSALTFPFQLSEVKELKRSKGSFLPIPWFYVLRGGSRDFLDFMLKGSIVELSLRVSKILGGFIGVGTATDERGRKRLLVVFSPTKFFVVNMEKNPAVYIEVLEPIPKRIATTSDYAIFEETGMQLGVDNFDPLQHSLITGTSGTGKSKFLGVLMRALEAKYGNNLRIIVVDPHGEIGKMLPEAKIVNFVDSYIEPLDVGSEKTPMLTQLVAQLVASSIGQENKYAERVLFYAVHLLTSIDKLELKNISALLTDPSVKAQFVSKTDNDEVKRFFDEEYNDIYIHHFNNAILPILNFIGEYELYLGKAKKRENLLSLLRQNRITIVSFDPHFFGRRMISFLAGAITNQMYILAITHKLMDKPTIFVVDEFPRVETRITRDILAETRKFNLFAYLSCQYLGQLSKEVLDSIISNVRNIVSFKVNRQDATRLSSVMEIKIEEYFKKHRSTTELEESKKEMFVRLHQRECIVRLYDGKRYLLPMKLRVVDMKKWGLDEVDLTYVPREEPPPGKPSAGGGMVPAKPVKASKHQPSEEPAPEAGEPPADAEVEGKAEEAGSAMPSAGADFGGMLMEEKAAPDGAEPEEEEVKAPPKEKKKRRRKKKGKGRKKG